MKNIPEKIYLQTGIDKEDAEDIDFKDLHEGGISWHSDRIYESDIEYVQSDTFNKAIELLSRVSDKVVIGTRGLGFEVNEFLKSINHV